MKTRDDIRNIAIIAHVDHGKTTLVNEMLKQSDTLDQHIQLQDRAMDTNAIEKERQLSSAIRPSTSSIPRGMLTLVVKWNGL